MAASVPRDNLVSPGTCFGKFTKTQKFRLSVTALDFLAPYAKVGHGSPGHPALGHRQPHVTSQPHITPLPCVTPLPRVTSQPCVTPMSPQPLTALCPHSSRCG